MDASRTERVLERDEATEAPTLYTPLQMTAMALLLPFGSIPMVWHDAPLLGWSRLPPLICGVPLLLVEAWSWPHVLLGGWSLFEPSYEAAFCTLFPRVAAVAFVGTLRGPVAERLASGQARPARLWKLLAVGIGSYALVLSAAGAAGYCILRALGGMFHAIFSALGSLPG